MRRLLPGVSLWGLLLLRLVATAGLRWGPRRRQLPGVALGRVRPIHLFRFRRVGVIGDSLMVQLREFVAVVVAGRWGSWHRVEQLRDATSKDPYPIYLINLGLKIAILS